MKSLAKSVGPVGQGVLLGFLVLVIVGVLVYATAAKAASDGGSSTARGSDDWRAQRAADPGVNGGRVYPADWTEAERDAYDRANPQV